MLRSALHRPPRLASARRYATTPSSSHPDIDEPPLSDNDFILSILRANPSLRDTKSYLANFGHRPPPLSPVTPALQQLPPPTLANDHLKIAQSQFKQPLARPTLPLVDTVISSILNPVVRRTALVKIQGPFTDVRLESIARGLVYLEKLGLVSVIVVDNDELGKGQDARSPLVEETMRIVSALERQGARARPILEPVVRLGPADAPSSASHDFVLPEAHTVPSDLIPIRSALAAREFPVIAPFSLDSLCCSTRIDANDVLGALARGMAECATHNNTRTEIHDSASSEVDLTPLRLMIISREGGVPSYARSGYPHLLINLTSEYDHIHSTFHAPWKNSHPTALKNLALARTCLAYMPSTSSAIMVSHRSPSSLIANLITNKPAVSSSLPHALLQGNRKLTAHTPTLLRRGLPIRVIRNLADVDRDKMKTLLEHSFRRTLNEAAFYNRLESCLDFVIVAGDYAGAAIVTNERSADGSTHLSYLDKFAVLPNHQGDGTVDFLWVALHDESYGLGHPFSVNPNGGRGGQGEGRDLVWRSRADNPVNKWYFERSTGHMRLGHWVLFWCDAEKHLKIEQGKRGSSPLSYIEHWEQGRIESWSNVVTQIPSSWA